MQLHQILMLIPSCIPIIVFDSVNIEICRVYSKDEINIDLYEYDIATIYPAKIKFDYDIKTGIVINIYK